MDWSKASKLISDISPLISRTLEGPLSNEVGAILCQNMQIERSPEALEKALNERPEFYSIVKSVEGRYQVELEKALLVSTIAGIAGERQEIKIVNDVVAHMPAGKDRYGEASFICLLLILIATVISRIPEIAFTSIFPFAAWIIRHSNETRLKIASIKAQAEITRSIQDEAQQ